MGNKHSKGAETDGVISKFDPTSVSYREALAAWHRYGVNVDDVYETVDVIGQGHMGEVTKVRRKERRGAHNEATRQTLAEEKKMIRASQSSPHQTMKKKMRNRHKKVSAAESKAPLKSVTTSPLPSPLVSNGSPKTILRKSSYKGVPNLPIQDFEEAGEDETEGAGGDEKEDCIESAALYALKTAEQWQEQQMKASVGRSPSCSNSVLSHSTDEADEEDEASLNASCRTIDSDWSFRTVDSDGSWRSESSLRPRSNSNGNMGRHVCFQRFYACKTVTTSRIKKGTLEELLNEIYVMRSLDHPYILPLFEVYQVKRKIWLITELCTGGDLTSRKLDEPQTTVITEQILCALAYMHKHNTVHRNLKLENILYENSHSDATVRLIDFGLSQTFDRAQVSREAIGTAYTMSPEIASGRGTYTDKTDMWAIGVIVWILLAGDFPFVRQAKDLENKCNLNQLINADFEFGITWRGRGISVHGKEFCIRCLKKNPKNRWTSNEALDYVQNTWIPAMAVQVSELEETYGKDGHIRQSKKNLENTIAAKRKVGINNVDTDESISIEDITRFCTYGRMKKAILMAMAHTMDRNDVEQLSKIFLAADTEDTGTLNFVELKNAVKQINASIDDASMEKIFEGIDQDHSGEIYYAEFLAALVENQGLITMDRLAEAFDRIDTDGKGYISRSDLRTILGNDYDKTTVDKMIKEADFKKNGQIDYEELLKLMIEDPKHSSDAAESVAESLGSLEGFKRYHQEE